MKTNSTISRRLTSALRTALSMALALAIAVPSASAADFGSKKYYINPGHGGHDSNDRPTPLPLGVEIFYESDGTLSRGLFMRTFFQNNKAQVKMSRTTNTSADDLGLSTIAANSNSYGGYFMSLHTNGANNSANYIVAFFRSASTSPTVETVSGAKTMTTSAVNWQNNNHLTNMTYSTQRALGDYSFYGYNLGVLRTNNRPGYLVETVFHDYRPDGLRLKSDIYNKYTGWQLVRAAAEKSGSATGSSSALKGCIIGDIRDLSESCGYTNYTSRGRDKYLAVNGAKVVLKNSSGTEVGNMTTDKCCNGLFGFFDLTAGTYTLEFSKSGYKTQTKTVTVANNASTKVLIDFVQGTNSGIEVSPAVYEFKEITLESNKLKDTVTIKVAGTGLSDDITIASNKAVFTVNKTSLTKTGGSFKIIYSPTAAGSHSGTITLTSGTYTKKISVSGTTVNPPLTFSKGFNYGEITGLKPDWLPAGGWGLLRNMCFGNGKLYIVNPSEATIYVVKAQTAELITKLDMTGVKLGTFKVMDVKCVGDKVLACNLVTDDTTALKVYQWDNDYAKPTVLLNTKKRTNSVSKNTVKRLGDTFDYDGDLDNGRLIFAFGGDDTNDAGVFTYQITNGVVSKTPAFRATRIDESSTIKLGTSPRAKAESDDKFWIMGQNYVPTLTRDDGYAETSINIDCLDNVVQGNDFVRFTYKGEDFALATSYGAPSESADGKTSLTLGGAYLLNASGGLSNLKKMKRYPAKGLGTTRNTNFSTSVCVNVNGKKGAEFWVLISNQGLGYFKTGTVPTYTYTEPDVPVMTTTMSNHNFGKVIIGNTATHSFKVTAANLTDPIKFTIDGAHFDQFEISASSLPATTTSKTVTVTYRPTWGNPDSKETTHTAALTISCKGFDPVTYTLTGTCTNLDPEIKDMEHVWTHTSTDMSWWSNTGNITRSMTVAKSKAYFLNCSGSGFELYAMHAYGVSDHSSAVKVNTTGISGGTIGLAYVSSIPATNTGTERLYGCNLALSTGTASAPAFDGTVAPMYAVTNQTLKIYRWDESTSAPELVLSDATHGDVSVGDQMGTWGTETNGKIMFAGATPGDNSSITKLVIYTVTNGTINPTPEVITLAKAMSGNRGCTDVCYNGDGTYWVTTKGNQPTRIDGTGKVVETLPASVLGSDVMGTTFRTFDFGGMKYAAAITYLNKDAGTLANGAVKIVDMTDGAANAKVVDTYPENGLGATRNTTFTTSLTNEVSNDGLRTNIFAQVPMQGATYYKYDGQITGVEDVTADKAADLDIRVYGHHVVIISDTDGSVTVTDTAGRTVLVTDATEFDIDEPGVFIVSATAADGSVKTAKVAVR